ncbi:MAG TPA: 5-methyltetrahydropteroyltriglutamate--homocysteine S-methyltransferase [Candidatus Limnocylindrales bacterium]|nr:5-methyltetrahydropteroyltriglutamate--homocysteine S-methyltransferase [Candidatus Limnocylindrales bacterium]
MSSPTATLIGYPRIGPARELKWTLERAWSGRTTSAEFVARAAELREAHLAEQRSLVGSAVDDYFVYDELLETAMQLGLVPDDLRALLSRDPFEVLTVLARGSEEREAWEMTKWFDTNYHYVVPEITGPPTRLQLLPWRAPIAGATWVVLGPYSVVKLSKLAGGQEPAELAGAIGRELWDFARQQASRDPGFRIQVDEPSLGMAMTDTDAGLLEAAYAGATDLGLSEPPLVTVQFGRASSQTVASLGRRGLAVQVRLEDVDELVRDGTWETQPEHVVSVMDGRSVWSDEFAGVRERVERIPDDGRALHLVPSTSLMFLPYTVEGEDLPPGFAFAREKATALAAWASAIAGGEALDEQHPSRAAWPEVGEIRQRAGRSERKAAQSSLDLPLFPTTSTGSLPQTGEVRQLRVRLNRGEIDRAEYEREVDRLIGDAIAWQEGAGIDVLVHGEFERTDMVEFFAEKLDGFHTTRNGWVLSYGSRSTRPPILAAPPSARDPMTVREWGVAQSAGSRPVKGMLTGPVTIVNWSFRPPGVPDDRLFWAVAQPIASEVAALVDAGARVVQIDEPAVRERWPLPTADSDERRGVYARGVRAALNHVFNQPPKVQMHTHMCYGDFGDIVPLWADAGVDVASIEFSRSKDESYIHQFYELFDDGHLQIGPGVFDVHSPHSPGTETMASRLEHFRGFMDVGDLWVNPDCGLKTRSWPEVERQLTDMVEAARRLRSAAGANVGAG